MILLPGLAATEVVLEDLRALLLKHKLDGLDGELSSISTLAGCAAHTTDLITIRIHELSVVDTRIPHMWEFHGMDIESDTVCCRFSSDRYDDLARMYYPIAWFDLPLDAAQDQLRQLIAENARKAALKAASDAINRAEENMRAAIATHARLLKEFPSG